MVTTACNPEPNFTIFIVKHWRADGQIGQVRSTIVRRVDQEHVARLDICVLTDSRCNGRIHGAEMHWHVRCIGNQIAFCIKHGAREIETFFDVDRIGRVLERYAHLLCNRHEEIVENLKHHRIGFCTDCCAQRECLDTCQNDMIMLGQAGLPTIFDDNRLVLFDDDCRAGNSLATLDLLANNNACIMEFPMRKEARALRGFRLQIAFEREARFRFACTTANCFDFNSIDDQCLVFCNEPETALMCDFKFRTQTLGAVLRREGCFN